MIYTQYRGSYITADPLKSITAHPCLDAPLESTKQQKGGKEVDYMTTVIGCHSGDLIGSRCSIE